MLSWGVICSFYLTNITVTSGQIIIRPAAPVAPRQLTNDNSQAAEDDFVNVFVPADRETLKKLSEARRLLADDRYTEAVRNLGAILDAPEDYLVPSEKNSPIYHSLKSEAQRLIGQMPRKGREIYELQYGARARRMLDNALESGDPARLAEVARRFFHTQAGYQATFLLGQHYFEHGRPLAAACVLRRLQDVGHAASEFEPNLSLMAATCWLQAGMPEAAQKILSKLRNWDPSLRVTVGGRETPIFTDDARAIEWLVDLVGPRRDVVSAVLDGWWLFRGDAARNASLPGGAPLLNLRWRVGSTDDPLLDQAIARQRTELIERGQPVLPAMHPLVVGDTLLMRTVGSLLAVDLTTGKRLWQSAVEEEPEPVPTASGRSTPEVQKQQMLLLSGVSQRVFSDAIYGTLSSDGLRVFAVEDMELGGPGMPRMIRGVLVPGRIARRNFPGAGGDAQPCNRLAAYDIRTGKLLWNLGGPTGPHALKLAETFFLGPPLPLMGQLYVLAETKGEIRLMALEAATGELIWSQQLAMAEENVDESPVRRLAGASPSHADGILVCPTSAGAVVGVDLATRSLLWGYCYNQVPQDGRRRVGVARIVIGGTADSSSPTRWIDGSATISNRRVLIAPVESQYLYCLDLIDGRLLWKCLRQDDLYVACVDGDNVVLVGRKGVRAIKLADGSPAWNGRTTTLPADAMPSGRGFASDGRYYLPLSNAEIAGIDLSDGRTARVARSRQGAVPGNLIGSRGQIISQGLTAVDAFRQRDAARKEVRRRLATDPKDAEAIALEGEILLDAGQRAEAIAAFRRAYAIDHDPRTHELLRDVMLEGLLTEFAVYRRSSEEIERLLDSDSQRATFLRAMATGLRHAGESTEAMAYYQKLMDLDPDRRPLDEIDKTLLVRRDRWIRGQLAGLRADADEKAVAEIDQLVAASLEKALAAKSVEPLQQFLDDYGEMPPAAAAREELARRLTDAGRLLEAELAGAQITPTAKPAETSKQSTWPTGLVEVESSTKQNRSIRHGRTGVEFRGGQEPLFGDLLLRFDANRQAIVGFDGLGNETWQVPLSQGQQKRGYPQGNFNHARANGHVLLVALGWRIAAIDMLGLGKDGSPRLLWCHDLVDLGDDMAHRQFAMLGMPPPLQMRHFGYTSERLNLLAAAGRRYVCFQRLRHITAVDPISGETLWTRRDLPSDCTLFGDDQYIFAVPPNSDEAVVLRALDGITLGTRKIPRAVYHQRLAGGADRFAFNSFHDTCLATLGRNMLLWWPEGNRRVLTLVDPLEGRDLWPERRFSAGARACVVADEVVGVMEPNGRFVLVSLDDGRTLSDVKLESEPALTDITLFRSGDQYFLLTNSAHAAGNPPSMQPMPGGAHKPIYRGRLYALDRQGKPTWPAPALIKNQFLMNNQPDRLPVVLFAVQRYEQKKGRVRFKATVLCIDKRDGRIAYKSVMKNPSGVLQVTADDRTKTVELAFQRRTTTLQFTDKPIPPPDAKPAKSNSAGALWDAMKKLFSSDDESEWDVEEE